MQASVVVAPVCAAHLMWTRAFVLIVISCLPFAQVTAYRAGHVLGACMFEVEIAGMRLLYTGDYSRVPDRHLSAADTPDNPPHIGELCHHTPVGMVMCATAQASHRGLHGQNHCTH